MKKIIFFTIILIFSYFFSFSQDTTYIAVFINGKEVVAEDSLIKIEIKIQNKIVPVKLSESKYFITNNINGKFNLLVKYGIYKMSYKVEPWILKNKLSYNIDTYPFESKKKKVIFNRKKKYLYFISISPYLSKAEVEKSIKKGILYNVLQTKTKTGKL